MIRKTRSKISCPGLRMRRIEQKSLGGERRGQYGGQEPGPVPVHQLVPAEDQADDLADGQDDPRQGHGQGDPNQGLIDDGSGQGAPSGVEIRGEIRELEIEDVLESLMKNPDVVLDRPKNSATTAPAPSAPIPRWRAAGRTRR